MQAAELAQRDRRCFVRVAVDNSHIAQRKRCAIPALQTHWFSVLFRCKLTPFSQEPEAVASLMPKHDSPRRCDPPAYTYLHDFAWVSTDRRARLWSKRGPDAPREVFAPPSMPDPTDVAEQAFSCSSNGDTSHNSLPHAALSQARCREHNHRFPS